MEEQKFTFELFPAIFAVCRLHAKAPFPAWAKDSEITMLTRTPDEVSVLCAEIVVPKGIIAERNMRLLRIKGTLDFNMVGVLASILAIFSEASISVFVFSTYDTDYFLVKENDLERALAALYKKGHTVNIITEKKN